MVVDGNIELVIIDAFTLNYHVNQENFLGPRAKIKLAPLLQFSK
jgi:hypothetical protein